MSSAQINQWVFESDEGPILSSEQLDNVSEELGVHLLPEMIFQSFLSCKHLPSNTSLHFYPVDALKHALKNAEDHHRMRRVLSMYAKQWETSGASSCFEHRGEDIDWTFSTTYKGSTAGPSVGSWEEDPPEGIDYEMLTRKEEILYFRDLVLYEDELHDCGMCELRVKIRVMQSSFFILMRFWVRVDNVLVRIIDTRVFHAFGRPWVVREWTLREGGEAEFGDRIKDREFTADPVALVDKLPVLHRRTEGLRLQV